MSSLKKQVQGFSIQLVRKFAQSILQSLDALHKNKIIHCGLKPENILLKQHGRSAAKVIDFGSAVPVPEAVHLYPVSVLQSPGDHPGKPLQHPLTYGALAASLQNS